ncbi:hypothetical protein M2168_006270 [Streptomyces sp. CZ24]|uniref:hypothetical protein n=1 Tax=Streptomyces TaxID=1883 RepID=UPI00226DE60A|nr:MULTISPECIES: hypothetical protein [unclassified Streptomyces]MDH6193152.1 hypothetical protein [Streptomyces sp. CZ24]WAD00471.1 hypothetical protein OSU72_30320 [Streptomyces sp. NA13]
MTRTPNSSSTELGARVTILESAIHTALAQLGATTSSGLGEGGDVCLAVEVLLTQPSAPPTAARRACTTSPLWV